MSILILIVIYISYIGLGVPDSLFGTAWPALYRDLGIPVGYSAFVTLVLYSGTVISSLISARLVKRFGTGLVGAVSTTMTVFALIGFARSQNLVWLLSSALPLGLGAGSIDAAMNNYVAQHYSSAQMSFLHAFYGIGVTLSPYFLSIMLEKFGWRGGYQIMIVIQGIIALIMIAAIPLWKKIKQEKQIFEENIEIIPIKTMLKMPAVRSSCGVFIGSCAIESVCLTWSATYLCDGFETGAKVAAQIVTFYFLGLTFGRMMSGIMTKFFEEKRILIVGQSIVFLAVFIVLIARNPYLCGFGLFLVGLGNGPVFPNMSHLTPILFGKEKSQSIISFQMAIAYIGIMICPAIFGFIAQKISIKLFPVYLALMFVIMVSQTFMLFKRTKKNA
ncbi:MAG TPA: MFS transporter [Clostridiales bacterium]|nr:MFS transporter [Clostridiales bacterium]